MISNCFVVPTRAIRRYLLTGLVVLLLPGIAHCQDATAGFVPVPVGSLTSNGLSVNFLQQVGPSRDGKPTRPLRWAAGSGAVANFPPVNLGWDGVDAVQFWLYLDKARSSNVTVVLTGQGQGYFSAPVPINFTGWKLISIPIDSFKKNGTPDLSQIRSVGLRAIGYGQAPLEKDAVWWIDGLSVHFKAEANTKLFAQARRQNVIGIKNWGVPDGKNPILDAVASMYADPLPAFSASTKVNNTWDYRTYAEALVPLAYAVSDPRSPQRGRPDLVQNFTGQVDWLVGQLQQGAWWLPGMKTGDENTNRFVLGPLLDAILQFKKLPEGNAAWNRWQGPLQTAVDYQKENYEDATGPRNKVAGLYVNQDVYYALIMALSSRLWNRASDDVLAKTMVKKIESNLLPDGGFHYIGQENESPVYHIVNVLILGRYLTITGDPVAKETLAKTANYWPLTLSAQGQPECWSDVWWKQAWPDVDPNALIVSAATTGDGRTKWLLNQVLARVPALQPSMRSLYAAPYWRSPSQGEQTPLPENFLLPDRNIRGIHGRAGNFYFGLTRGRGLRDTFAGGMVSLPGTQPLDSALRFVGFDVITDPKQPHGLWLSQINDRTALAFKPGEAAALGAVFSPQPNKINAPPTPATPDTGWRVTQIWRAAGDGLIGQMVLESTRPVQASTLVARVGLGPAPVTQNPDGSWNCGNLHIVSLQSFGDAVATTSAAYAQDPSSGWPAIDWRQDQAAGTLPTGTRRSFAVWVGPDSATPPVSWQALPDDAGWIAKSAAGKTYGALFNPSGANDTVRVPWQGALRITRNMGVSEIAQARGAVNVTLAPTSCVLLDPAG